MGMQVCDAVCDHGRVDVLGACFGDEGSGGSGAPPSDGTTFVVVQVGPAWCVPARFHDEVAEIDHTTTRARSARADVRDDGEIIRSDRAAGHERGVFVFSAHEALREGFRHGMILASPGATEQTSGHAAISVTEELACRHRLYRQPLDRSCR
jgi:hypothetical protein